MKQTGGSDIFGWSEECAWSLDFGLELAKSRNSVITARDLLSGLFLGNHEQFLRCFSNLAQLHRFFVSECGIEEPVWFYWFKLYERQKNEEPDAIFAQYDDDANVLLQKARSITRRVDNQGMKLLTLESVLLAAYESQAIPICRMLMSCGFDYEGVKGCS